MSQKNILVTGATARQGQAFISALRDCDYFHILALTRNRSSQKAKWLASAPKVTIIEGDLDSEAFIRSVFEGRKVRMLNPMAAASGFSGARRYCRQRRETRKSTSPHFPNSEVYVRG